MTIDRAYWENPTIIANGAAAFERIIFTLLGITVWEIFVTFDFEVSVFTGHHAFRWPLLIASGFKLLFFSSRYCIVLALMGLIISLNVHTKVNCGALYTFISWAGNTTILCASTSLMLRTLALWDRGKLIMYGLGSLCLAHWGLLCYTMSIVHASWEETIGSCVVTQTNPSLLNSTFFFTMGFDFVIMFITVWALYTKHTAKTSLRKLLFKDGLVYFIITASCNLVPAVLNVLNLNPIMNVVATVPAAAISSLAAGRAVMRLRGFRADDVYIQSTSGVTSSSVRPALPFSIGQGGSSKFTGRPEVHVTTEHFSMAEFPSPNNETKTKGRRSSDLDLDQGLGVRRAAVGGQHFEKKVGSVSSEYTIA